MLQQATKSRRVKQYTQLFQACIITERSEVFTLDRVAKVSGAYITAFSISQSIYHP
jgi:hypothetical protein